MSLHIYVFTTTSTTNYKSEYGSRKWQFFSLDCDSLLLFIIENFFIFVPKYEEVECLYRGTVHMMMRENECVKTNVHIGFDSVNFKTVIYIYMFNLGCEQFYLNLHCGQLGFLQHILSTPIYKRWYFCCVPMYVLEIFTGPSEKVRNLVITCLEGVGSYHSLTLRDEL